MLASASPRRKALLSRVFRAFDVVSPDVDEDSLTTSDPHETALRLSVEKAKAVAQQRLDAIVIGGDTVVAYQTSGVWVQLAKPASPKAALEMLTTLSGRSHVVITGVAVIVGTEVWSCVEEATVTFRSLAPEEMGQYVATGEPMDKAGAYAIQGGAAPFVSNLDGDIDCVVGLPVARLVELMRPLPFIIGEC